MEDGGSMSRRNAGASWPSYTGAHPVFFTLTPPPPPPSRIIHHIVTVRFSAKYQNMRTNTVCRRKPFLGFWIGVCHQNDVNIPVIFRVRCIISPKPWYSYIFSLSYTWYISVNNSINPLNAGLNPIFYLLALVGAHTIIHINRIRVKGEVVLDPKSWNTVVSPACSVTCARDRCVSVIISGLEENIKFLF
jgi:hypothetical protein